MRIKFDELPKHCMPRSSTARFTEKWQKSVGDEGFLEGIVDRWRNASSTTAADAAHQVAMFAEAMNLDGPRHTRRPPRPTTTARPPARAESGGASARREVARSAASPRPRRQPLAAQPGNALRAIRDRLQQR